VRYNLGPLRPEPWSIKILADVPGLLIKKAVGDQ